MDAVWSSCTSQVAGLIDSHHCRAGEFDPRRPNGGPLGVGGAASSLISQPSKVSLYQQAPEPTLGPKDTPTTTTQPGVHAHI